MTRFLHFLIGTLFGAASLPAADVREAAPSEASKGKVHAWKSADGVAYRFVVPRSYDPDKGANLTFVLHGSNLTRKWGFANHKAGEFRPDDIVVSPDGTTPNGKGGFNFLGKDADVKKFEALQNELKEAFKVNATFLYGHSQGSFFALHYAGARPGAVQGVVAHASGLWTWSKRPAMAHHQAIVLMHGTQDPVVSYGQSAGGYKAYRKAGYPMVRLRTLEGWNHWPAEHNGPVPHVSQQLAWIEGMTTRDVKRLGEVFKTLGKPRAKAQHDYAALYFVAKRMLDMRDLPDSARRAAERAAANVEALADEHVAALSDATPDASLESGAPAWIGHLPMFLRAFEGIPAAESLREKWKPALDAHASASSEHLGAYYKHLRGAKMGEAFRAGTEGVAKAYLMVYAAKTSFLDAMDKMADESRKLGIDNADAQRFRTLSKNYRKALEAGRKSFESVNKRASL